MQAFGQAHFLKSDGGAFPCRGGTQTLELQDRGDLLQGRQSGEQVEALEDEAAVIQPEPVDLVG